ncbi:Uncharacterised protein [uncultured archaeon]|nr:Uncharacterised protein [uncultured archaeon]
MPDERIRKVVFLDKKVEAAYLKLADATSEEQRLHSQLEEAFKELKKSNERGIKIPSKLWPKEYARLGIDNLWKYDMDNGWRLIYTLSGDKIEVMVIILEWFGHKEYAKRFGYKVG